MWSAYYAPARRPGEEDPSRHGFATEDAAWDWVFANKMCDICKDERANFENGIAEHHEYSDTGYKEGDQQVWASSHPACACEWFVLKTEDLDRAEGFGDILEAAGFQKESREDRNADN